METLQEKIEKSLMELSNIDQSLDKQKLESLLSTLVEAVVRHSREDKSINTNAITNSIIQKFE
jgi:hypothetical protein